LSGIILLIKVHESLEINLIIRFWYYWSD